MVTRIFIAAILAIGLPKTGFSQFHFASNQTIPVTELHTGNADADSKIDQFFAGIDYLLSYNIQWVDGTATLYNGIHGIDQTFTITIGNDMVANRSRENQFTFTIELKRNASGDYNVEVPWIITDPSEPVQVTGKALIGRIRQDSPGTIQKSGGPQEIAPDANGISGIKYTIGSYSGFGLGHYQTISIWHQRVYFRDNGAMVITGYWTEHDVWIPDSDNPADEYQQ